MKRILIFLFLIQTIGLFSQDFSLLFYTFSSVDSTSNYYITGAGRDKSPSDFASTDIQIGDKFYDAEHTLYFVDSVVTINPSRFGIYLTPGNSNITAAPSKGWGHISRNLVPVPVNFELETFNPELAAFISNTNTKTVGFSSPAATITPFTTDAKSLFDQAGNGSLIKFLGSKVTFGSQLSVSGNTRDEVSLLANLDTVSIELDPNTWIVIDSLFDYELFSGEKTLPNGGETANDTTLSYKHITWRGGNIDFLSSIQDESWESMFRETDTSQVWDLEFNTVLTSNKKVLYNNHQGASLRLRARKWVAYTNLGLSAYPGSKDGFVDVYVDNLEYGIGTSTVQSSEETFFQMFAFQSAAPIDIRGFTNVGIRNMRFSTARGSAFKISSGAGNVVRDATMTFEIVNARGEHTEANTINPRAALFIQSTTDSIINSSINIAFGNVRTPNTAVYVNPNQRGWYDQSTFCISADNMITKYRSIVIRDGDLRDSSMIFIDGHWVSENEEVLYIDPSTVEAGSKILISGHYETDGAGQPAIYATEDIWLHNALLLNDGTVSVIDAPNAITVFVSGSTAIDVSNLDPDITLVVLEKIE